MHDLSCGCDCCRNYSEPEQEAALDRLHQAVESVRSGSDISTEERGDLDLSEVVRVNAGFRHPIPAVMFHPPSRLRKLKAGFTYSYLLEVEPTVIATSILSKMRKHLAD
jgi:hypothetical protein